MKKIFSFFVVVLVCIALSAKLSAQTVYVTDGGKKYHAKNCTIVKTGKKSIELNEAKKKGYTACASCKAPKEAAVAPKAAAPAPKKQPAKTGK